MEPVQKALELSEVLTKLRPLNQEQEAIIMQKFRLDWNYNSNNLEGNSLTFGETKALILFGITAQGKPLKDHMEITGHNEAINWVIDVVKGEYDLTENFIRELHTLLLKESYEVNAITPDGKPTKRTIKVGQYKTTPNHVQTKTGEIFRFSTPEETPSKMHDLLEWYRSRTTEPDINAIILAAEFHYRFIRIHPFDDGNGRTARILMNFILMKFGYPPVIIKTEDKENYFAALQQADAGIIQPFIDYIAVNLIRSLEIMIAGAKGESIDEPDDVDKEIALLEQRLKQRKSENKSLATKDVLLQLFDDSLTRMWNRFLLETQKFHKFYVNNFPIVKADQYGIWYNEPGFNQARDNFIEETKLVTLDYHFSNFNDRDVTFNYQSVIYIEFQLETYEIRFGNQSLLRDYGQQLKDSEIEMIVKALSKAHTAFIDEKLSQAK